MTFDSWRRFVSRRLSVSFLVVSLLLPTAAHAGPAATAAPATVLDDPALGRDLDAFFAPLLKSDEPGTAVLVARNGKAIYRKGFGLADYEKKTPMTPDAAFRIGSVTKQFTAACILKLAEQGKLSVKDEVTKYLPDFPTHGKTITIENLLTHTSGIANYTDLPAFDAGMAKATPVAGMIDFFKDEPLKFDPGTKWSYSNSGYFLLGAIIEKVSGKTYEDYLTSEILRPLGMTHSGYGKDTPSFPGEVQGYARENKTWVPAAPISMTQPYAAGAIVSTVDDLLRWDESFYSGRILKPGSINAMFTPYTLPDGSSTHYGYGWLVSEYEGHALVEHNGGINGFRSHVIRMPDDHVYVAVLTSQDAPATDPGYIALQAAAEAIGKPLPRPGNFTMTAEQLGRFAGVYQIDSTTTRTIVLEDGKLYSQRSGSMKLEIFPTSDSTFAFVGRPARLTFRSEPAGGVKSVTLQQGGISETAVRTAAPTPAGHTTISLDPATLGSYVGRYELAPNFILTISREGAGLTAQATGQPAFEIFPESETSFFLKVVDAQIEFQREGGKTMGLVLHQNGRDMPGKLLP